MKEESARRIAYGLVPAATEEVTDDDEARSHVAWVLIHALSGLPEPDQDGLWLAAPAAYLLVREEGRLFIVEAATIRSEDESRPSTNLNVSALPLDDQLWRVELSSRSYVPAQGQVSLRTNWTLHHKDSELAIEGDVRLLPGPSVDAAEVFARTLAGAVGFPMAPEDS